ncbi:DNA (cytosine-5)-methyltransferase 3B-like [Achroia grisella]|uniref:DNA (cytosine-5)-methyltransferase 3B-like n=1 Tax=Achroia grisella TaxID=688607 RepID=UPI0027D22C7F|nr:DNA (cytosine-5)-methyltransferase 3B-like [Achroia grisella]
MRYYCVEASRLTYYGDGSVVRNLTARVSVEGRRSEEGAGEGGRRFSAGDVVWGRWRGFASWPGVVQARGADGRWRVRWFGAAAAAALPAARLLTLSEGLEAHHAARSNLRKSRKLNVLLENAIQEAMAELDKKSARGAGAAVEGETSTVEDLAEAATRTEADEECAQGTRTRAARARTRRRRKKAVNPAKPAETTRLRSSR